MTVTVGTTSLTGAIDLLYRWLSRCLDSQSLSWVQEKKVRVAAGAPSHIFFTAFSAVPRYTGKTSLDLTLEDLQAAAATCPGWMPGHWRTDQVGRTLILLSLLSRTAEAQGQGLEGISMLDQIFSTADVDELVALYQALPLFPHSQRYCVYAVEGVRSNMTVVFNAIALQNPYPAAYFDTNAWNQMVLKALFVGSPLYLIQALDRRTNPELAQMLVDYAHERWAAKRLVSPELWRALGQFTNADLLSDLQKVLNDADPAQREAAALTCAASPDLTVQAQLVHHPDLQAAIQAGRLTWESFSCDRLGKGSEKR